MGRVQEDVWITACDYREPGKKEAKIERGRPQGDYRGDETTLGSNAGQRCETDEIAAEKPAVPVERVSDWTRAL